MMRIRKFILLMAPLVLIFQVCSCGGGSEGDPNFELNNPLVSISTLRNMTVDQFTYYLTDTISEPDIEIWITDADTDELLVCAHGGLGMGKVLTEGVMYGNLNATFQGKIESEIYEGRTFKVLVYHNEEQNCVKNNSDEWFSFGGREKLIGTSDPVNYNTLTREPIFATNGGFYVRFKETSEAESYPVPFSIVGSLSKDQLVIDQSYLSDSYRPTRYPLEMNVYVVEEVQQGEGDQTETDASEYGEMIGCAGSDSGLGSAGYNGVKYGKLLAEIIDENRLLVKFSEHKGKKVKVVMSNNYAYEGGCPKPIGTDDVIIGESPSVLWDDLSGSRVWVGDDLGYVVFNSVVQ